MQKGKLLALGVTALIGLAIAGFNLFRPSFAQTDASVTPLAPGYGGSNYDQPLWTITYDKAVIPVSFTYYHCTSAALVLEYATWADYTKLDWQTGATNKYTGFIPASASDLSQKVYITIPNLTPSTSYIFRVGAQCTSSSPMGSLVYATGANQFSTPAAPIITYSGRATFQAGDAGGSIENNTLLSQKVINLRNTGSSADTFRTTLPLNPGTRCGLKYDQASSYPSNVMPNTLPTSVDVPLGVNETKYIVAVCVTNGLAVGPFTWSYKTVSVGALNANRADVNSVIAEVQDTVNVTEAIVCNDSDGGTNTSVKGTGTGTYAGARSDYKAIYGQEPNPTTPKSTADTFSTFIDHCANSTQLNEAYCDASGRLQAIGVPCQNGCSNGVCIAPPQPSQPSDLVGWWKFDGNGNNEVSSSPAAGVVGNSVFNASGGKVGGYAYIPTGNDSLRIPYRSTFDLPDSFTVQFWFRQRADRGFLQDLVYKGTPQNNYNFRIFRQLWNQNNFGPIIAGHTTVNTGYWTQASNPNQLEHNVWHHVAYTKSSTAQTYYLDGILTHSKDFTQYTEYAGPAKTPQSDIIIGDSAVDTDIDDLKIYNRALSNDEIRQSAGLPIPTAPAAPSGLTAVPASNGVHVSLRWTDNSSNEGGFYVYRRVVGTEPWTMGGSTSPNIPYYTDSYINEGLYEYKITAFLWDGMSNLESAPSNYVTGRIGTNGTGSSTPSVGTTTPSTGTTTSPIGTTTTSSIDTWTPPPQVSLPITTGTTTNVTPPITPVEQPFLRPAFPEVARPIITEISTRNCKPHLAGIRSELIGDKQFWKGVSYQLKNAPEEYSDRGRVLELLSESKNVIVALERAAKRGKCGTDMLTEINSNQQKLHGDLFAELRVYLPEIQEYAALAQCVSGLNGRVAELKSLSAKKLDEKAKNSLEKLIRRIEDKIKEFTAQHDDFEYDAVSQCRSFQAAAETESASARLATDEELNKIIDDVVAEKFEPIMTKLTEQMEERGKQIDTLLVNIAELHKVTEKISKSAAVLSENIAVSYTAMQRIEEKFRSEIQETKDQLIPLVESAVQVIGESKCLPRLEREVMVQELGNIAAVNWIGARGQELESRLNLFIASCRARDVADADIKAFHTTVADSQAENLKISYEKGITPFPDVDTHKWYFGGMLISAQRGFMTQGRPEQLVLRQDALLMLLRVSGMTDSELKGDCSGLAEGIEASFYARCAVTRALEKGLILKGNMTVPVQRGEVALWIAQLLLSDEKADAAVLKKYTDIQAVDQTWRDAIAKVVARGVMVGQVAGQKATFDPHGSLTRAALAVVIDQLLP